MTRIDITIHCRLVSIVCVLCIVSCAQPDPSAKPTSQAAGSLLLSKSQNIDKSQLSTTMACSTLNTAAGTAQGYDLGNGVFIQMIAVPAGDVYLPRSLSSDDVSTGEIVHIDKPFMISKHRVSQRAWVSLMGHNPSHAVGGYLSVDSVSWQDCIEFCKRISQHVGQCIQLPTEAEWYLACSIGRRSEESQHLDVPASQEASRIQLVNVPIEHDIICARTTHALDICGLNDGIGEWCCDWYSFAVNKQTSTAPALYYSIRMRVVAGINMDGSIGNKGCEARSYASSKSCSTSRGFRIVCGGDMNAREKAISTPRYDNLEHTTYLESTEFCPIETP